jgi:copper chaperone CopZ
MGMQRMDEEQGMSAYRVDGMTCEGCVRAVTRALQGVAQGREITVDRARARVEIIGAEVDESVLRAAVEDAGFVFAGRV